MGRCPDLLRGHAQSRGDEFCAKLIWDSGEIDYAQVIGTYLTPDVRARD
jgi:hypothetical protein